MKTQCPHCHVVREAPDDWVNKKAKCPACQTSFTIAPYSPRQKLTVEGAAAIMKQRFASRNSPPRILLTTVWEVFGWIWFTVPMIASLYVIAAHRDLAIPYLLIFAPLAFLPSMLAFTAAEIIRALHANIRAIETFTSKAPE